MELRPLSTFRYASIPRIERNAVDEVTVMLSLDLNNLLASLLWGSVGAGFFIYGKKCGVTSALVGGLAMIAVSYFVGSPLFMSLISVALIAGTVGLIKHGY